MSALAQDSALRLALAMMAADRTSGLQTEQRAWIIARLQLRRDGVYPLLGVGECTALLPVVLAWAQQKHPRLVETLQRIFGEEDAYAVMMRRTLDTLEQSASSLPTTECCSPLIRWLTRKHEQDRRNDSIQRKGKSHGD